MGATSILVQVGQFFGFWAFWDNVWVCLNELFDVLKFSKWDAAY